MTGIIYFILLLFLFLFFYSRVEKKEHSAPGMPEKENNEVCCGWHEVCEKKMPLSRKNEIEYFDDEDLDVCAKRDAKTYTDEEIEQFAYVFYTLQSSDVLDWIKSLQRRDIQLPENIRDEVLMIVRESYSIKQKSK